MNDSQLIGVNHESHGVSRARPVRAEEKKHTEIQHPYDVIVLVTCAAMCGFCQSIW